MRMTTMTDMSWTGGSVRTTQKRLWSNDADECDIDDGR